MPAYVVAEVEVADPGSFEKYRKLVAPTIAQYGGASWCAAERSSSPPACRPALLLCGGLKILYDLMLLAAFRNLKPPEERA